MVQAVRDVEEEEKHRDSLFIVLVGHLPPCPDPWRNPMMSQLLSDVILGENRDYHYQEKDVF